MVPHSLFPIFGFILFFSDELYLINLIFTNGEVPQEYNKSSRDLSHDLNHAAVFDKSVHKYDVQDKSDGTCHEDLTDLAPDGAVCHNILEGDGTT